MPKLKSAVKLDPTSRKLVNWYAEESLRDPADIINGIIAGNLSNLQREPHDDSPEHCRQYVEDAIRRRTGQKPKHS